MRYARSSMASCSRTSIVLGLILLNLLLGLRGLWREDRDFFTMHPFSDPIVRCTVRHWAEEGGRKLPLPFPKHTYRQIPASSFTKRFYLEALPLFARGLEAAAQRSVPAARVAIRCQTVHPPPASFHS